MHSSLVGIIEETKSEADDRLSPHGGDNSPVVIVFTSAPQRPDGQPLLVKLVGKAGAEHGMSALGLFPCGLVLNDVPVFSQQTVLNANNVYRNPVDR